MELPEIYRNCDRFSLGDNPSMANSGLHNVISKKQIATSGSFELLNKDEACKPFEGKVEIVLDGADQPGLQFNFRKSTQYYLTKLTSSLQKTKPAKTLMSGIPFIRPILNVKAALPLT